MGCEYGYDQGWHLMSKLGGGEQTRPHEKQWRHIGAWAHTEQSLKGASSRPAVGPGGIQEQSIVGQGGSPPQALGLHTEFCFHSWILWCGDPVDENLWRHWYSSVSISHTSILMLCTSEEISVFLCCENMFFPRTRDRNLLSMVFRISIVSHPWQILPDHAQV